MISPLALLEVSQLDPGTWDQLDVSEAIPWIYMERKQKTEGLLLSTCLFIVLSPPAYLFCAHKHLFRATQILPLPQPTFWLFRLQIPMWDDISAAWERSPPVPKSTNLLLPYTEARYFPHQKQMVKGGVFFSASAGWGDTAASGRTIKTGKVNINVWKHNCFLRGTKGTSKRTAQQGLVQTGRDNSAVCSHGAQKSGRPLSFSTLNNWDLTLLEHPPRQVHTTGLRASQVSFMKIWGKEITHYSQRYFRSIARNWWPTAEP